MVAVPVIQAAPQPAITLSNVQKQYGGERGVLALDRISTQIRDREFVSLIGPSGCGKSTLLRIISGLTSFEADEASVFGQAIAGPPAELGIVFQTANLLPWRTVAANLSLAVELRGHKTPDLPERTNAMLAKLGLEGFGARYPHELSGGMKQRVAIGQALMANPRVLLMDEPFGALDALTRDHLNVELLRIWQAERKTVVMVTHSISEAIFLSDRALVMSARPGRIIEDIRIDLPRPRDPRTTRQHPEFGRYVVQLSELMGIV
ncbi:MAG: ABC transporter ATP-binding protein [Proteobacteria bacterium]|nr:ABC transporter ATP-binding protein [Pseudomonadota bacterium]